jgi:hypothetical protein
MTLGLGEGGGGIATAGSGLEVVFFVGGLDPFAPILLCAFFSSAKVEAMAK